MTQIEHKKPPEIINAWMAGNTGYFRDYNNHNEPIHAHNSFIEMYIRKDIHDKEIERLRANEKVLVEALNDALCEIPHGTDCAVTNLVIENAYKALAQVKHEEK